jgi:hypothetical protein
MLRYMVDGNYMSGAMGNHLQTAASLPGLFELIDMKNLVWILARICTCRLL